MDHPNIVTRFGATVRALRSRLGISQEELANRADLHRTYIAGVEGGSRNITLKSIEKLARALEVSVAALLETPALEPAEPGVALQLVEILLIEDNRDDAVLTVEAFREARIANPVHVARDGAEALDFVFAEGAYESRKGEELPKVILLDLNLPKISGLEVLRRIKRDARTKKIPVIALTGSQNGRDMATCKELGVLSYIVKPVNFSNFSRVTPELALDWALLDSSKR